MPCKQQNISSLRATLHLFSEHSCLLGQLTNPCHRHIYSCSTPIKTTSELYCEYSGCTLVTFSGRDINWHDQQFKQCLTVLGQPLMASEQFCLPNLSHKECDVVFQALSKGLTCQDHFPRMVTSRSYNKSILVRFIFKYKISHIDYWC